MASLFGMVTTERSKAYTPYALKTFFEHTSLAEDDLFVLVDNDGTYDPGEFSTKRQFAFRRNAYPKSFASNMNYFLDEALPEKRDAYLLNNDIIFARDWMPPLDMKRKAITSASCNMQWGYSVDGLTLRLTMDLEEYLGKEEQFSKIVQHHKAHSKGYKLCHSFPYYCVRIPYSVYAIVGKFDESYGMAGWEDTDYTARAYQKKIPLYFALDSFVLHFYGKSTWTSKRSNAEREHDQREDDGAGAQFAKRWGKKSWEVFGRQTDPGMAELKELENEAITELYGKLLTNWSLQK